MKKYWLLEETDKKMIPMKDKWALAGNPPEPFHFDYMGWKESTILKLTEFSSNPLEPIKEIWEKWFSDKRIEKAMTLLEMIAERDQDMVQAISECMKRMEGK